MVILLTKGNYLVFIWLFLIFLSSENVYKTPKIKIIMTYYTLFTIRVVNTSLVA